ncbi:hypothetical protein QR680_015305 [Steinernema hermaphroditum]|uniref:Uncharacterized protein n=1 Tax=Steinernema hermaphroditum TaxID=289476 RepID=A0AA39H786_9BILA|nr:hypothetical protein QR680_015305 [Steinernema hermaphroditum]
MHFVVGICLVLLPFLVAYLIYYVIDLVYLMCVESCAKKGDTKAPAELSFSNPNFKKDACDEDSKANHSNGRSRLLKKWTLYYCDSEPKSTFRVAIYEVFAVSAYVISDFIQQALEPY